MLNVQTTVAQIVLDHSAAAAVFQKHRIDYCCRGHLPFAEACAERGADAAAVQSELEAAIAARGEESDFDPRGLDTAALVAHIVDTHHAYLREALPFLVALANKVARVHGARHLELLELREAVLTLNDALLPHLDREEEVLFPALIANRPGDAVIQTELQGMHADHLEVAQTLEHVRSLTGDFTIPFDACTSYSTLFRELEALEGDVLRHVHLENHVLMPRFAARAA